MMSSYYAKYRDAGAWVPFTVLGARNAYRAYEIARAIVGPTVGLAVFGRYL